MGPPLLDDGISETLLRNSYIVELRDPQTLGQTYEKLLNSKEVSSRVSFQVDGHTSHLIVVISREDTNVGTHKLQKVAKLRVPARGMLSMSFNDASPNELVDLGVWRKEWAENWEEREDCVLYSMEIKITTIHCSIEGIRIHDGFMDMNHLKAHFLKAKDGIVDLHLMIRGGVQVRRDYEDLVAALDDESKNDPLKQWFPGTRRKLYQIGKTIGFSQWPTYAIGSVYSFWGFEDYMVRMGFGLFMEQHFITTFINPTNYNNAEAILVESAGLGSRGFFVLIPRLDNESFLRVNADDTLEICFDAEHEDVRFNWNAKVMAPLAYTPTGWITALATRPWDKDEGKYKDNNFAYPFISLANLGTSFDETCAAINTAKRVPIRFKCQVSDRVFRRNVSACEQYLKIFQRYQPKTTFEQYAPTAQQTLDLEVILNNNPCGLPYQDAYLHLRKDFPYGVAQLMQLSPEQKDVIDDMTRAKGGWTLVQGPPGTGKTHVATQAGIPFFESTDKHHIMYISATNAGVDDMAKKLDCIIQELKQKCKASKKYVIRIHSVASEQAVSLRPGREKRGVPAGSKPKVYNEILSDDEQNILENLEAARILHDTYIRSTTQKYPGIQDPRVRELSLSLGHRSLQVLGVIQSNEFIVDPENHKHAIEGYRQFMAGEISNDDMVTLRAQLRILREDIMWNADAVVTTIACAGSWYVYGSVSDPELLVIDEAARALEYDLIPLWAFYPQIGNKLLVGDIWQLLPVVRSLQLRTDQPGRNFASQLRLSLMHRLQSSNFGVIELREQFRAIPSIAKIYNNVTYKGTLRNGSGTAFEDRPLAQAFRNFNKSLFGRESNVVFIDLSAGQAEVSGSHSQYNNIFCKYGLNLVQKIIEQDFMSNPKLGKNGIPILGVLMAYQAQWLCYTSGQDHMALKFSKAREVEFDKIDRRQGHEWDVVIVDLTITENIGFQREINRLNVLFSRSRCALYVLGNKDAMDSISGRGAHWLREFYGELLRYRVTVPDENIHCQWFHRGQVDISNAQDDEVDHSIPVEEKPATESPAHTQSSSITDQNALMDAKTPDTTRTPRSTTDTRNITSSKAVADAEPLAESQTAHSSSRLQADAGSQVSEALAETTDGTDTQTTTQESANSTWTAESSTPAVTETPAFASADFISEAPGGDW